MPSYLHGDGLPGFLPVENGAGEELGLQGVRLDGGPDGPALTGNDDVGVGTCMEHMGKEPPQQKQLGGLSQTSRCGSSPPTSCAVLVLQLLGSVDVDVSHSLWVPDEGAPAVDFGLVLRQLPARVEENL